MNKTDIRLTFFLGVDRYNVFGEKAKGMKHPNNKNREYTRVYLAGIRAAEGGRSYRLALNEFLGKQ